ncbi:MAG TPA: ABC transporter ATP-binding protein [Arenicellales bacterium]|nr:ABC transporter ATP-binding protein [Arenicellales bacterium]
MASDDLLKVSGLRKSFGGLQAVADVSFRVQRGAIYGLIGPNGSGKTTVFNLLTGFLNADGGSAEFQGESILGLRPFQVARCGICRTFQAGLNPRNMTVMENMLLAAPAQTGESLLHAVIQPGRVSREETGNLERARDILATMMIDHMADEPVGSLSGGQRKLLSLAQALMAKPRLILLDEPVAGVNPRLIDDIVEVIRRLRDEGRAAFLIVEHNMSVVRRLCDEIAVLDAGQVIASGPTAETLARDDVLRAYLGSQGARDTAGGSQPAEPQEA